MGVRLVCCSYLTKLSQVRDDPARLSIVIQDAAARDLGKGYGLAPTGSVGIRGEDLPPSMRHLSGGPPLAHSLVPLVVTFRSQPREALDLIADAVGHVFKVAQDIAERIHIAISRDGDLISLTIDLRSRAEDAV